MKYSICQAATMKHWQPLMAINNVNILVMKKDSLNFFPTFELLKRTLKLPFLTSLFYFHYLYSTGSGKLFPLIKSFLKGDQTKVTQSSQ